MIKLNSYYASSPSFFGSKVVEIRVIKLHLGLDVNVRPFNVDTSVMSKFTPSNSVINSKPSVIP